MPHCGDLLAFVTLRSTHHCGVAATNELADFVEDALAVDGLIQRAPLHDDCHSQQDLLTDILLKATGQRERETAGIKRC